MKKKMIALLAAVCLLTGCSGASALTVDVPTGFQKTDTKGVDAYYICEDNSNINWVATKKSDAFAGTTPEALEKDVIASIGEQADSDFEVSVVTNSFAFTERAGNPAYEWDATYTLATGTMRQLVVCIDAEKQYTVTYTDTTPTEEWMDTFYKSAEGLTLAS